MFKFNLNNNRVFLNYYQFKILKKKSLILNFLSDFKYLKKKSFINK